MRKTIFCNNEYYHIYNRGVDKRKVFLNNGDYKKFIINLRKFNSNLDYRKRDFIKRKRHKEKSSVQELSSRYRELSSEADKLIEIIAYCLNPNHYHFILRQLEENGISKFMHKVDLGYTNYFNPKYNRNGSLFQGTFKSIHIDTDEYLIWLSAYINLNPKLHNIASDLEKYPWSSYLDYVGKRNGTLCNREIILNQFPHKNYTYKNFIDTCLPEMKRRKDLRKYFIE